MTLAALKRRLLLLIHRDRALAELAEEMALHIEHRARRLEAQGVEEPGNQARRRFGNATRWKEESRDMWGWTTVENLIQDFRHALRIVGKSPAFSLSCILTLGLGVGVNTAIFSTINAVLLRPLPYRDAARLVEIFEEHPVIHKAWIPYPDYLDFRSQNNSFEDMAAYSAQGLAPMSLVVNGSPEQVQASMVSGNLLPLLGVRLTAGENFQPSELKPGQDQVAILGHSIWLRRFNGNRDVVGQFIELDGKSFRIAGVLPRGIAFPITADVLVPVSRLSEFDRTSRKHHELVVIGRLKAGVTMARAASDLRNISLRLQQLYPATNNTISSGLVSLNEELVGDVRAPLLVLLAAVGLILLIACSNVANLLLSRAVTRSPEIALRAALGASRLRQIQQLLLESSVLSLLGGVLGVIFAAATMPALRLLAEKEVPRANEITLDPFVLSVALAVTAATGILFGLPPAFEALRQSHNAALRSAGRGVLGDSLRIGFRRALVVLEVSLSIVVLTGAGLLVRSFSKLLATDPGLHTARTLTFSVPLSGANYQKPEQYQRFFDALLPKLAALPSVDAVATTGSAPFTASPSKTRFAIDGEPRPEAGKFPVTQFRVVSPTYFDLLGIPIEQGRGFRNADLANNAPGVVMVNRAFARRFLSGREVLGRGIVLGVVNPTQQINPVVGVAADVRDENLANAGEPILYFPGQANTFLVKTKDDPLKLIPAVEREVHAIDPEQPVADVRDLDQLLRDSLARRRFSTMLLAGFSALALALAAVGLYGLISYSVTQRTREIGVRVALGSSQGRIAGMVLRESLLLTLAGVAAGFVAAFPATRLLAGLLYGVRSWDPATICGVALLLVGVALAAAIVPARRATAVDPMVALRYE